MLIIFRSPSSITFTSENWDTQRTITVSGEDDTLADGSQSFSIVLSNTVSSDSLYNGTDLSNVSGTNYGETRSVATPSISPDSGTFTAFQNCTITCSTSEATIRYELGTSPSDPTASSTVYGQRYLLPIGKRLLKQEDFIRTGHHLQWQVKVTPFILSILL